MLVLTNSILNTIQKLPITVETDVSRKKDSLHIHYYTQIFYVLAGTPSVTFAGKSHLLEPGTCTICLPYTEHYLDTSTSEDTPIVVTISFFDSFLSDRGHRFFSYSNKHARFEERSLSIHTKFSGKKKDDADAIIRQMTSEFRKHHDMCFDRLAELTADLLRLMCSDSVNNNGFNLIKERADAITASIKYMIEKHAEKVTIAELCNVAAMSRTMYTENFRAVAGVSPMQFLLSVRLNHARALLMTAEKTLEEIASECGFYDRSQLTKLFTKHFGISPKKFREDTFPRHSRLHQQLNRWKWLDEKK